MRALILRGSLARDVCGFSGVPACKYSLPTTVPRRTDVMSWGSAVELVGIHTKHICVTPSLNGLCIAVIGVARLGRLGIVSLHSLVY